MSYDKVKGSPIGGPYALGTLGRIGYMRETNGSYYVVAPGADAIPRAIARVPLLSVKPLRGRAYDTPDPVSLGTAYLLAAAWDMHEALRVARTHGFAAAVDMMDAALWKASGAHEFPLVDELRERGRGKLSR